MSTEGLERRIARIAADRQSGASELLAEAAGILAEALAKGLPVRPLATALITAQPSMAPMRNAVRAALIAASPADFDRYVQRTMRAPAALVRHAIALLGSESPDTLRLVTISFSATVLRILESLAQRQPIQVSCSDGQPGLEGRRLTERLAAAGIAVTHYTDAALGHAIAGATAALAGADAVTPDWFLNKSGTRMLAAVAGLEGVPVYVAATLDKFVSRGVAARLHIREEPPGEVWPAPPAGVRVRNPYFEATSLDVVSAVISEAGVLGGGMVVDACPTAGDELLLTL
jgi:translation initiation factor 2B subunit (eIF-2B alpha/beta/delta family)